MSGYREAMEAAGATVLAYESFGSYHGDWFAKVEQNGKTFFVQGSYGSCSCCDAFKSEFGYSEPKCSEHEYTYDVAITEECKACETARNTYQTRLAAFGQEYLDNAQTFDEMMKYAKRNEEWDMEVSEMVKWLETNR